MSSFVLLPCNDGDKEIVAMYAFHSRPEIVSYLDGREFRGVGAACERFYERAVSEKRPWSEFEMDR